MWVTRFGAGGVRGQVAGPLVMGVRPLIYSDWAKVVDVFRKVTLSIFSYVRPGGKLLNSYKVY